MCAICGRSACMASWHPAEEQTAFEPAVEAYEKYLEVRDQCREEWNNAADEDTDD